MPTSRGKLLEKIRCCELVLRQIIFRFAYLLCCFYSKLKGERRLAYAKSIVSILVITFLLGAPLQSLAAFNPEINYQAKLTDSAGDAVTDASYSIVFSLYTASSGGTAIWTETRSVSTTDGLFSVMLGNVSSLAAVDFNQTLYLGVKVGSDSEMTPRKKLGAVPAAFEASQLSGAVVSDFLSATTTNATATITALNVTNSTTTNATTTSLYISGNQSIAGNFLVDDSTLFVDSANNRVGIGTTTPATNLTVFANTGTTTLRLHNSGTDLSTVLQFMEDNIGQGMELFYNANGDDLTIQGIGEQVPIFTAERTGRVGIGKANPSTELDVVGTASSTGLVVNGTGNITGNLTLGSLNGPLQANAGVVSATTSVGVLYGGTGLTSTPSYGQLLVGNGTGYTLSATSSLNIALSDTVGTLSVAKGGTGATTFGQGWLYSDGGTGALAASTSPTVNYITATSTSATSTFAGGLAIETSGLVYDYSTNYVGIGTAAPASILQLEGSGTQTLTIQRNNSTAASGGLSFRGSDSLVDAFINYNSSVSGALAFGIGAGAATTKMTILDGGNVGIGDTSPDYNLDVTGNARFTSFVDAANFVATSTSATSTFAGGLAIETSGLVYDYTTNNVGINTSSPTQKLHVAGSVYSTGIYYGQATAPGIWLDETNGTTLKGAYFILDDGDFQIQRRATAFGAYEASPYRFSISAPASSLTVNSAGTVSIPYASSTAFTVSGTSYLGTVASGVWNGTTVGVGYGGTGLSSTPSYGQMLVGNGTGYTLTATSSLNIALSDTVGTLSIAKGGTNATSQTTNGVNYFDGTSITSSSRLTFSSSLLSVISTSADATLNIDGADDSDGILQLISGTGEYTQLIHDGSSNIAYFRNRTNGGDIYLGASSTVYGLHYPLRIYDNTMVFNDESNDYDIRFEGDTDANLLYLDAGNSNIGIGTAAPAYKLEVNGSASTTNLYTPVTSGGDVGIIYHGTDPFIHTAKAAGTSGYNTFLGVGAGNLTFTGSTGTQGSVNTVVGASSGSLITTGDSVTIVGGNSGAKLTSAVQTTVVGAYALQNNVSNHFNTAVGAFSLYNTTGGSNSAFGHSSGRSITTGTFNTFIGREAGYNGSQLVSVTNSTALGYSAYTTASNQVVIGSTTVTQTLLNGSVGIGTTTPKGTLHVKSGDAGTVDWSTSGFDQVDDLVIEGSGHTGISILGGGDAYSKRIVMGDKDSSMFDFRLQYANGDASFYTQNTFAMVIDESQRVGIGDLTPDYKLDVTGNARFTSLVDAANFVATSTTATSTFAGGLAIETSGFVYDYTTDRVGIGTASPTGKLELYLADATASAIVVNRAGTNVFTMGVSNYHTNFSSANDFRFSAGSVSDAVTIQDNTGYLGVGTTTPAKNIHISALSSPALLLSEQLVNGADQVLGEILFDSSRTDATADLTSTSDASVFIRAYSSESHSSSDKGGYLSIGTKATDTDYNAVGVEHLRLTQDGLLGVGSSTPFAKLGVENTGSGLSFAVNDVANDSSPFVIDASGNVGIGELSPDSILEIAGSGTMIHTDSSANNIFNLDRGATSNRGDIQFSTAGSARWYTGLYDSDGGAGDGTEFYIGTSAVSSPSLWLETNGNVGIGDSAPDYKLDVTGNARFTSLVDAANFVATSTTATSTFAGGLAVETSGLVYDYSTNFVGIGTASPTYQLQLNGTAGLAISGNTSGGTFYIRDSIIETDRSDGMYLMYGNNSKDINFQNGKVVFKGTGGVGVGTTTPWGKLSVTSAGASTGKALVVADSSNNPKFVVQDNGVIFAGGGELTSIRTIVAARTSTRGELYLRDLSSGFTTGTAGTDGTYLSSEDGFFGISGQNSTGTGDSAALVVNHVTANQGKVGVASTTPWATLSVRNIGTHPSFVVEDVALDTTPFLIDASGNVGIGTTTPGTILSIGDTGTGPINFSATATSTFGFGINLRSGCFAIAGTCLSTGGSGTPAGSSGNIQFNSSGSFDAESDFNWDSISNTLDVASSTGNGVLFAGYINGSGDNIVANRDAVTTYISKGKGVLLNGQTASAGGSVYIAPGGDDLAPGGSNGGAGGTVYLAVGGSGDSYGANGTVNVGDTNSSGGTLNLYADTLFKDSFSNVGSTNVCWDGTGGSNIGSCTSLRQYKDNIQDIDMGLEEVMALRPRTFNWKDGMGPSDDLGFIADEVEAVDSRLATYNEGVLNGVKYSQMSALLVRAIQEQQVQILDLQNQLASSTAPLLAGNVIAGDISGMWTLDEFGHIKALAILDLGEYAIQNVRSLSSFTGKWSIDENGKLIADEIETNKLTVKNGITTKDKTTGELYCIYIDNGVIETEEGSCEDLATEEEETEVPPVDDSDTGSGGEEGGAENPGDTENTEGGDTGGGETTGGEAGVTNGASEDESGIGTTAEGTPTGGTETAEPNPSDLGSGSENSAEPSPET